MRRAFTLIELLVVIAIIAILAAILFPVFAQAKLAAKQTTSLNSTKQVMTAHIMYAGDVDDTQIPYMWMNRGDGVWLTQMEMVNPYIKSKDLFMNPAMAKDQGAFGVACTPTAAPKVMSHYVTPQWIRYNYWNWWGTVMFAGFPVEANAITSAPGGVCDPAAVAAWSSCTGAFKVDEPSNTALIIPGYFVTYNRPSPAAESNTQFGSACTIGFDPTKGATSAVQVFKNGSNYGMVDGHAKYYSTNNMNGNASRPHRYGGANYPSSPYMVVKD